VYHREPVVLPDAALPSEFDQAHKGGGQIVIARLKRWLEFKLFHLKTGIRIEIANDGKPIDELVIRHGDYFFMIALDAETGEPTGNFGWSHGSAMTHIPIREFYTARRDYEVGDVPSHHRDS
jgi:hypothetical protein